MITWYWTSLKIYFGDKKRNIFVDFMVVRHTQINFTMPPGEGANLTIFVEVSNQTGHSYNVAVTYARPEIKSIRASHNIEDSDSIYPTSGCLVHEQIFRQNFVGTLCDVRVTLRIRGKFWETRSTFSKIHKFCWRRKNWHHLNSNILLWK